MEWNDILFLFTLISCLNLAETYKKLEDAEEKKLYGSCVGLFVTVIILGPSIIHPFAITLVNSFIILQLDRRWVHIYSFIISWLHLILLHSNLIQVPWQTIAIQMIITLRLVGLSFEVNTSYLRKNQPIFLKNTTQQKFLSATKEYDELITEPTFEDIFHYTYCFVGIHRVFIFTGPYYTWKTFNNYFNLPFSHAGDCKISLPNKMKWFPVCFAFFFIFKYLSPCYNYDLQTYSLMNLLANFFYNNIPQVFILLIYQHMISTLNEAICIEAGFVVYPKSCHARPGVGPTTNFSLLKNIEKNPELAFKEHYNFGAIKNNDDCQMLLGRTMRKSLRGYNMTVQYWFWSYIYRRLPFENKIIRTSISMFFWCLWSGPKIGNFIMISTILLFIYTEDSIHFFMKGSSRKINHPVFVGFSLLLRHLCLLYIAPTQFISDSHKILTLYDSVYWCIHILLLSILAIIKMLNYKDEKDIYVHSVQLGIKGLLGSDIMR